MSINAISNNLLNTATTTTGQVNDTGTSFGELLGAYFTMNTASIGDFSDDDDSSGFDMFGSSSSSDLFSSSGLDMFSSSGLDMFSSSGLDMFSSSGLDMFSSTDTDLFSSSSSGTNSLLSMMGMGGTESLLLIMMMLLLENQGVDLGSAFSGMQTSGTQSLATQCDHVYVDSAYLSNMTGGVTGIPENAWEVANAPLTNNVGQRDPDTYRAVMNQFNVESNPRYTVNKNGIGDTYCNIYVWDVTRAMGAEIPHYLTSAGEPVSTGGAGITETNANMVNDWLNTYGPKYGWKQVSAEEAQQYANQGMPAITSWKNPSGHGHLQMVSPSADGGYDTVNGVAISQAGRLLINDGHIVDSYGNSSTLSQVEYFVHI